tara:strand:- start:226 stop:507 length:282 start_codon:yes stop_codon:yes gene_type:complete
MRFLCHCRSDHCTVHIFELQSPEQQQQQQRKSSSFTLYVVPFSTGDVMDLIPPSLFPGAFPLLFFASVSWAEVVVPEPFPPALTEVFLLCDRA